MLIKNNVDNVMVDEWNASDMQRMKSVRKRNGVCHVNALYIEDF